MKKGEKCGKPLFSMLGKFFHTKSEKFRLYNIFIYLLFITKGMF